MIYHRIIQLLYTNCYLMSFQELDILYKVPHTVPISAHHKWNFDDLLEKIWTYLALVRM